MCPLTFRRNKAIPHFVMTGASLYSPANSLCVTITDPSPSQDS